mmetsp:Transcript_36932/g.66122  ORF Transcript_36932/g.66122 Transcript_36932/m.66122 type:complete len:114 (-) Transcript_36932:112-453(-)
MEAQGEVDMSEHHKNVDAYLGCGGCMGNYFLMWTSKSEQYNNLCPLGVIGGLYQAERAALEPKVPETTLSGWAHVVKDVYAPVSYERVNVVYSWLQELIAHRQMYTSTPLRPI